MKKIVNKIVLVSGAVALLLGMGLNLQYALDDYGLTSNVVNQVMAQTTGDTNPGDVPKDGWTGMYMNCYDQHGQKTGQKYVCYQPGYKSSCTPHACN